MLYAVIIAFLFSQSAPPVATPYVISANVQVSASQSSARHYESYVGADPKNASRLFACAYVVRANDEIDNVYYLSLDGGQQWSQVLTIPNAVDPSCVISAKGTLIAGAIHDVKFPDGKTDSTLSVHRSQDGQRWQEAAVQTESRGLDRAYVTVDGARVYAHGYHQSKTPPAFVVVYPSTNGGQSFPVAVNVNATKFEDPWFFPGNGVVSNDGTFFAVLAELDNTKNNMSYRTDAASAPQSANAVMDLLISKGKTERLVSVVPGVFYDRRVAQISMPALAIDRSRGPFGGRMYMAWPDARYGHRTQILLSVSTDAGRTWSEPKVVSDDAGDSTANNFMPAVAVNRDGVVGLLWYDRRDNPDNVGYWVRFSASLDGGKTWLPSRRVSTAPNVPGDDTRKNSGDTAGLAADAQGRFHPVWIDNRSGIPQMWTTTVEIDRK